MGSNLLTDVTSTALAKTLDAAAARQRAIANNIANVETPGYKRSYVAFEDELRRVMDERTGDDLREGLGELTPVTQTDVLSPAREDGNNVNIDAEIADMAKNTIKYRAAVTLMEAKAAVLRSAIQGR